MGVKKWQMDDKNNPDAGKSKTLTSDLGIITCTYYCRTAKLAAAAGHILYCAIISNLWKYKAYSHFNL